MKRIVPEFTLTDEQLNSVRRLAGECGLCEETVKILYGRGVRDAEGIRAFLNPSKSHFISPFKMSGMRKAVDLITTARDDGWEVVVYGDYDADGICAATILSGALKDFGIAPIAVVPERKNGYGLSKGVIDGIFEEHFPQLVITVDCGISCAEEVEYIKELGAEVIVTDHHELPENIPDCICVNPKFADDYIYDNLCGAGVAFKLACALNGERAYKYLDFAAIATVADSVSLIGENRDIVAEGLKLINSAPAQSYANFFNKQDTVTSQTIAFTVAPKINAAGRMGDANAALSLFSETDENKISALATKLLEYNTERQKRCDELYNSAKEMIRAKGGYGRIILLCNENWDSGFVGIVAARIVEEFSRPTILFVKHGDMLKGSARSIDTVNVFEALKACSEYIAEFGGHSQAAGVNVSADNFANLENALEEYMCAHYSAEDFVPSVYVSGTLDDNYSNKLVKELEMLEPFGVGNRRPLFALKESAVAAKSIKNAHLSMKSRSLELMYFGGAKHRKLLQSSAEKTLIFEFNISNFRGKEFIKGFVRDVVYDGNACSAAREDVALSYLETLSSPVSGDMRTVSVADVAKLIKSGEEGIAYITWDNRSLARFEGQEKLNRDMFVPSLRNFSTTVLYAPSAEADLSGYRRVIFLNDTCGLRLQLPEGVSAEICEGAAVPGYCEKFSCERDDLLSLFSEISSTPSAFNGENAFEAAKNSKYNNKLQIMFALKVFEQLGLVTFENCYTEVRRGVKSRLENSELYNIVKGGRSE